MPEREVDLWETTSGLPDDFTFTVTGARFVFDPNYNNGQTLLLEWEGEAEGVDLDQPLRFSCGNGWDTPDNGKTAVHPKQKLFNKRSHYGMLIDRCIKDLGMGDILRRRGVPTEAKVWVGLRFHMKRETIDFGGEIGEKERLLPVQFLGEVGNGKAAAKPAAPKTAAKPAPKAEPEPEPDSDGEYGGAPAELVEAVKKVFKKHKALVKAGKSSFDKAQEEALAIDGITDYPDLVAAVVDEESGLWAQA